jgi:prolyl oligopeptidase
MYRNAKRSEHVNTYHGVSVPDPYIWLEEDTDETKQWIREEVTLFEQQMAPHKSTTERVHGVLKAGQNYAKYSVPFRRGDAIYYWKNSGLQNQSVLYRSRSIDQPEERDTVVLDPNLLSKDGTAAISSLEFSDDASMFAYGRSDAGSDWQTIYCAKIDNATGAVSEMHEKISWVKFSSIAWTHDNTGFFYCKYEAPQLSDNQTAGQEVAGNKNQRVFYHRLGSDSARDVGVCATPTARDNMFGCAVSDDGRYLVVSVSADCEPSNLVWLYDLSAVSTLAASDAFAVPATTPLADYVGWPRAHRLVDEFGFAYDYITNRDDVFYFKSNRNAPKYCVLARRLNDSTCAVVLSCVSNDCCLKFLFRWQTVVAESDNVIENVVAVG